MMSKSGGWFAVVTVLGALLLPFWAEYAGEPFILDVIIRLMILAIAASSLNLILGYRDGQPGPRRLYRYRGLCGWNPGLL